MKFTYNRSHSRLFINQVATLPVDVLAMIGGEASASAIGTTSRRLPSGKRSLVGVAVDGAGGDGGCCDDEEVDGIPLFRWLSLKNKSTKSLFSLCCYYIFKVFYFHVDEVFTLTYAKNSSTKVPLWEKNFD